MFDSAKSCENLDAAVRHVAAAHADALVEIAVLDDENAWESEEKLSMAQWLAHRYGLTWATASEWVRVARALRELPAIAAGHRAGAISWDQLRPLTKFATPETDVRWAKLAPRCRAGSLWREAARHERVRREEAAEEHRGRYVTFRWNDKKTECYLQGRFGAEQGAELERTIRTRAAQIVLADDPYDRAGARRADALVASVAEQGSGVAADPVLVVHADVDALRGGEQDSPALGETDDGVRLCAETIQRIACSARIEWMVERNGLGVGIGFESARVPKALERQVRLRDANCCRFPGCGRRSRLRSHHILHWPHGPTDLDNLLTVCETHHRMVHEGGWSIRGTPSKGLRFYDPRGRPFTTMADSKLSA